MNKEINYLKEHLYEIYKYKKVKKDLTYDMNLELLRTCKALNFIQQENQQLKKQKDDVVEYIKKDWYSKNTRDINKIVIGDWRIDLLRMLGEIDD